MNGQGQSAGGKNSVGVGAVGTGLPTPILEGKKVFTSINVWQPLEHVQLV